MTANSRAKRAGLARLAQTSLTALATALACFSATAHAQEAGQASAAGDRTYEAAEFARFAPQTALDMLNQVPGFTIRQAAVERGLGQATGNVLLNGQRISNKSDDILAQLRRIPAENVIRIEIRDGATLGIPGLSGQVANVIARNVGLRGQWAYRPEFRSLFTDPLLTRFETSISGERGAFEYTIGLDNQASHSGAGGPTRILDASDNVIEQRYDEWTSQNNDPRLTGRLGYRGEDGQVANLNASVRRTEYVFEEDGFWTSSTSPDRERRVRTSEDGWDYEIGGDYEFGFGPGRLKLIGLDRGVFFETHTAVTSDFADGSPRTGDRSASESEETERVLRGEYSWRMGEADYQVSGEAAFNAIDNVTRLFALEPTGEETEIPFPNGAARVEEDRYEVMGTYGRQLMPSLRLQLSAGGEYSQLAQIGGNGLTREFIRPKGQISAVWQINEATRLNMRLQRRVGQLDFFDFLASVNLNDGTEFSGNPDLVPPQSWEFEAEYTRTYGAWGNILVRVYGAMIEDIVDIVPIGADGQSVGNLDEAMRYGAEFRSTTNFDPMGIEGLKLDTRFMLQESEVEDPLTGELREISGSFLRLASLTLRHDVPGTDWAWGASVSHERYAPSYRLNEIFDLYEMPIFGRVFVENKDVFGLTMRLTVHNVFDGGSFLYRTVHDGRRTDPVLFSQQRERDIGPIFSIDIRGRF